MDKSYFYEKKLNKLLARYNNHYISSNELFLEIKLVEESGYSVSVCIDGRFPIDLLGSYRTITKIFVSKLVD